MSYSITIELTAEAAEQVRSFTDLKPNVQADDAAREWKYEVFVRGPDGALLYKADGRPLAELIAAAQPQGDFFRGA